MRRSEAALYSLSAMFVATLIGGITTGAYKDVVFTFALQCLAVLLAMYFIGSDKGDRK